MFLLKLHSLLKKKKEKKRKKLRISWKIYTGIQGPTYKMSDFECLYLKFDLVLSPHNKQ